jgi:GT2 family glycosyltransferase
LIIVDDCSNDGTQSYLQYITKKNPNIFAIKNEKNSGFAVSCNRGARLAQVKYLVFLNNDTVPLNGWLDALVDVVERDESIAIVGAKLLYPDRTIQHAGVSFRRSPYPLYPYHIYAGKPDNYPDVNVERDYDAVTAACMLVREEVFRDLGGFDEEYINGYEDVDFCLRAREKGYRIVYTPKSVLYHLESQSPGRFDKSIKNLRRLHKRWFGKVKTEDWVEPKVSVVIVNYNGWDDTIEAVKSIFDKETYRRFQVIVIDNASNNDLSWKLSDICGERGYEYYDLSDERYKEIPPRFNREVIVRKLSENKGFGGGSNEGIKLALQWGADYIWLLNNNTIIDDLALSYLVSIADGLGSSVAIVGSKLHCYPETDRVQFDGSSVSYNGINSDPDAGDRMGYTNFVSGASMLVRADFLRQYGLLREDYFLYFEDNEICLRAVRNGFKVLYHPLSVVYHKGGASIGDFLESPTSIYYGIRNDLFFYEEQDPEKIEEVIKLIGKLIIKLYNERNFQNLSALFEAIRDFFSEKRGKREAPFIPRNVPLSREEKHLIDSLSRLEKLILSPALPGDSLKTYIDTVKSLFEKRRERKKTYQPRLEC